jgi:hypothetical protein
VFLKDKKMDKNKRNIVIAGAVATIALVGAYAYYSSKEEGEKQIEEADVL